MLDALQVSLLGLAELFEGNPLLAEGVLEMLVLILYKLKQFIHLLEIGL